MTASPECLRYLELFQRLLPLAEREESDLEAEKGADAIRDQLDDVWRGLSRQEAMWAEIMAMKLRYSEEFPEGD